MIDDNLKWESTVECIQKEVARAQGLSEITPNNMFKKTHLRIYILVLFNHTSVIVALSGDIAGQPS